MPEYGEGFEPITITLPERYWIVLLTVIEGEIENDVAPRMQEAQKMRMKVEDLAEGERALIVGLMTARAQIVDTLVENGVMLESVREKIGLDRYYSIVSEANRKSSSGTRDEE